MLVNGMNLIVYFSRDKNIRNIVMKYKDEYQASTYEIEPVESINFITKWKNAKVNIKRCNLNLMSFDNIILVSPLWRDKVPSPVIRFLEQSTGKVKNIIYILYNNNRDDQPKEFDKMDKILNLRRDKSYFVTLSKKDIKIRVYQ